MDRLLSRRRRDHGSPFGWYGGWTLCWLAVVLGAAASALAEEQPAKPPAAKPAAADENPFPKRMRCPSLDGGAGWLNTSHDISLDDLRGKVVVIDFWTFCCINCMHVLPDLKYLEKKYEKELVVIGVHSAKFTNEKETENIRQAIMRYEIEHPVVNDSNMTIWRKFGVRSWPTLALIDPEGFFCGFAPGEGNREVLDQNIARLIEYHRAKKTLDENPIRFDLEREKAPPTALRYPGKVLADEKGGRLFVSDSGHNRIVISSLDGKLLDVVGSGAIGAQDGSYAAASFDHPQGIALAGDTLYVADTENHLIRTIDLAQKRVATLAGTGEQARFRTEGGELRKSALNSPWDLIYFGDALYICMAGPHQLWKLDPAKETVEPYAGSGKEDILNGTLKRAALAQPSGIATDGEVLYVVDSEGSAVRKVTLDPGGKVTTVVGSSDLDHGRCLFEFGDHDGFKEKVRLQHPLGIAYRAGMLYVADSYNHKIKEIDLKKRGAMTFLGTGTAGNEEHPAQFAEPAGLAIAGERLFIADTNNHQIRVADLTSRKVAPFDIEGLSLPSAAPAAAAADVRNLEDGIVVAPQVIAAGDELAIAITLSVPAGYKLNKAAPVVARIDAAGEQQLIAADRLGVRQEIEPSDDVAHFKIPLAQKSGKGDFRVAVSYSFCREGLGGVCRMKSLAWRVPLEIAPAKGKKALELSAEPAP